MSHLKLSKRDLRDLEALAVHGTSARQVRRAQAALWYYHGESIDQIAERLAVSPQTIYNWFARLRQRQDLPLVERINDGPRSGRPATALGIIDPLIEQVIDTSPRSMGYAHAVWTAVLLQRYLHEHHQIDVCRYSVSQALKRLGIRWKRPRHQLSRRAAHWRQSKGGFSAV
jgi:transposase